MARHDVLGNCLLGGMVVSCRGRRKHSIVYDPESHCLVKLVPLECVFLDVSTTFFSPCLGGNGGARGQLQLIFLFS